MKILVISKDEELINILNENTHSQDKELQIYSICSNPLEVVSFIVTNMPSLIIMDDDFLSPDTTGILKSVKSMLKEVYVIFVTSDDSIELGREISQLGIHYYCIRPLNKSSLSDSVESIKKLINNKPY